MSENAKFIVTGDMTQIDLPNKNDSGLAKGIKLLQKIKGIAIIDFTKDDIVAFGNYCNLKEKKSIEILENTIKQFKKFEQLADEYKVDTILKNTILKNIRFDL